ncbi:MAG: extracellular solute-binding protein [Ignavibacteriaceae bacterium]|nr:extracellular solute-binding protein [Ignavibacteriaceae bacterium]
MIKNGFFYLIGINVAQQMLKKIKSALPMKIRFKQTWGLLILLFVSIAYLVTFMLLNSPKKPEVTEIYFADMITAAHSILINKFNKINEGKVKVIPIDFPNFDFSTNERKEMLARLLRGKGDGIDVFAVDVVWVQRFAKWSEPLTNYFSKAELDKILSVALESCYFEGDLYALPLNRVQGILYYRDDLLKKFDNYNQIIKKIEKNITWEDFIKLKNELNTQLPFYTFTATDYEGLICVFFEVLLSLNKNYFEQYGFNFNTIEAEKSLQLLVDLVNKYNISPKSVTEFTEVPSYQYFIQNDGLFIRGWPTFDKDFREKPFDAKKQSHLKKASLPYFKSGHQSSIMGGWNMMISKFSNKKEAAINFIKFLLKEDSQEIFYKEGGHYPVVKSFYQKSEYLAKYPEIERIKYWDANVTQRPANADYTRFSKIIAYYLKNALQQKLSVKEALASCSQDILTEKF